MCICVLPACMSMYQCVPGTYGSQKRALVPLEMNLQMVVSCWESYLSPLEEQPVLLTAELHLQPHWLCCETGFQRRELLTLLSPHPENCACRHGATTPSTLGNCSLHQTGNLNPRVFLLVANCRMLMNMQLPLRMTKHASGWNVQSTAAMAADVSSV